MGKMHQEFGHDPFDHVIVSHDADPLSAQNLLAEEISSLRTELAEIHQWMQNYEGRAKKYHSSYAQIDWSRLSPREQDHVDRLAAKEIEKWNETQTLLAEKYAQKIEKENILRNKLDRLESRLSELRRESNEALRKTLQDNAPKNNQTNTTGKRTKERKSIPKKNHRANNGHHIREDFLLSMEERGQEEGYAFEHFEGMFIRKTPARATERYEGVLAASTAYLRSGGQIDTTGYKNADILRTTSMLIGNIRNKSAGEDIRQLRWIALQLSECLCDKSDMRLLDKDAIRGIGFHHLILQRIETELRALEQMDDNANALLKNGNERLLLADLEKLLFSASDALSIGNIRSGLSAAVRARVLVAALCTRPNCEAQNTVIRRLADGIHAIACCLTKVEEELYKTAHHDLTAAQQSFAGMQLPDTPDNKKFAEAIKELLERAAEELRS